MTPALRQIRGLHALRRSPARALAFSRRERAAARHDQGAEGRRRLHIGGRAADARRSSRARAIVRRIPALHVAVVRTGPHGSPRLLGNLPRHPLQPAAGVRATDSSILVSRRRRSRGGAYEWQYAASAREPRSASVLQRGLRAHDRRDRYGADVTAPTSPRRRRARGASYQTRRDVTDYARARHLRRFAGGGLCRQCGGSRRLRRGREAAGRPGCSVERTFTDVDEAQRSSMRSITARRSST